MNILLQLLDYFYDPTRHPFPRKAEIADRMGVSAKTIQINMRALEQAGLIQREIRKKAAGSVWPGCTRALKKERPPYTHWEARAAEFIYVKPIAARVGTRRDLGHGTPGEGVDQLRGLSPTSILPMSIRSR
jgi:hypothetical protein